ncbi:hypothetical protein D9M72_642940 [compost metagenome]
MQAQGWVFGELNRSVPQAHVTWDRQARAGLGQACRVQAVLFEQGGRVLALVAHGLRQAVDKAHRQVPQTHSWLVHGLQPEIDQASTVPAGAAIDLSVT